MNGLMNGEANVAPKTWEERIGLLILLLAAFGWRLAGLTQQSLWRDEVDVIWLALRPLRETISMFVSPAQNGPLYFLLMRPWFALAGTSEYALRYTSALASLLAILLVWQVARRLLPGAGRPGLANIPLLAAFLMALHPYQLWYSQEGKMYALIVVLVLASTWAWLEAMHLGGWQRWLIYLIVTSFCIYTHLLSALILPVHFFWFVLSAPLNRQRWRGYALTLSGFVLPYLPLIWWQWHYLTALDYETGYAFTPFADVVRTLLLDHTGAAQVRRSVYWIVPLVFLVLGGALVGAAEDDAGTKAGPEAGPSQPTVLLPIAPARRVGMLVIWLVGPVLLLHGVSTIKPLFVDRYLIWIGPAFVLLLALGLRVVYHSGGRWARLTAQVLLLFVVGLWAVNGWEQTAIPGKTQLREAVTFVAEHRQPDQLLILQIPHTHYAYRYYTSDFGSDPFSQSDERLAPWAEGLWTQNGLSDEQAQAEVDGSMRQMTDGFDEVWVLLVEANSWDGRRLMDAWLDAHGTLEELKSFHGIEARRYRLRQE
ncbi:MAG: glycosyltransferase family 39 protein [Caldilineaceae bacterium]